MSTRNNGFNKQPKITPSTSATPACHGDYADNHRPRRVGAGGRQSVVFEEMPSTLSVFSGRRGEPVADVLAEYSWVGIDCQRAIEDGDRQEAVRLLSEQIILTDLLGDGAPEKAATMKRLRRLRQLVDKLPRLVLRALAWWLTKRLQKNAVRFGQEAIIRNGLTEGANLAAVKQATIAG